VSLFGPEDVGLNVFGADVVASRRFRILSGRASLSPYAVMSATLSRSHERSAAVTLADEQVFGSQAAAGMQVQAYGVRVAMEYGAAKVPNVSLKVGIGRAR
jgi:hypothetical protein